MKIVKGKLIEVSEADLNSGVFYSDKITEIGDNCFCEMPNLKKVVMPKVKKIGSYCLSYNQALALITIGKQKYDVRNVDGYCYVIEGKKTSKGIEILTGYNFVSVTNGIINKHLSFVASKEGFTAHGETVKKAISDLQFKMVAERLKKEPILPNTKITINHYRLVTGACEFGTKAWIEANNLQGIEEMEAKDLLLILERTGAWGVEKFKSLINW